MFIDSTGTVTEDAVKQVVFAIVQIGVLRRDSLLQSLHKEVPDRLKHVFRTSPWGLILLRSLSCAWQGKFTTQKRRRFTMLHSGGEILTHRNWKVCRPRMGRWKQRINASQPRFKFGRSSSRPRGRPTRGYGSRGRGRGRGTEKSADNKGEWQLVCAGLKAPVFNQGSFRLSEPF